MARPQVILRPAAASDVEAIVAAEAASWPAALAVTPDQARSRIDVFPEGQLVAIVDGRLVAVAWAQRVTREFFQRHSPGYVLITDAGTFRRSHNPLGEIYQLIGVGALPAVRGLRLGRRLVDLQIERARQMPLVRRIVGFTRPAAYHLHAQVPIDQYVRLRNRRGRLVDPVLAFHLDAGATLVSIHPAFRPQDVEAGGYGVLIEYPLSC